MSDINSEETLLVSMFGATELVDKALKDISGRDLVSAQEMTDLLLDIRIYLVGEEGSRQVVSS